MVSHNRKTCIAPGDGAYSGVKGTGISGRLWLIVMSLWFYGYFNISYLSIMIASVAVNYIAATAMLKCRQFKRRRLILTGGIIFNLGLLFYFKYFDFLLDNMNRLTGTDIPLKGILLPLGISFFTFQQIGFILDVYRGKVENLKPADYVLFVTFFPQLIAGPIVNESDIFPHLKKTEETISSNNLSEGILLFALGLGKKVLIADTFGQSVDFGWNNLLSINSTEGILLSLFYTLQLYFDFSGYCDMASGLARIFGIMLPANFNSPYKAGNINEFWKRWHITLNRFFTENLYIPLGGSRKGRLITYRNLLVVFILSGLWHGAGWNFIFWGLLHGILIVATRIIHDIKGEISHVPRVLKIILTFLFVNFAWIFFRAPTMEAALQLIKIIASGNMALPSEAFLKGMQLPELWYLIRLLGWTGLDFGIYIIPGVLLVLALVIVFCLPNSLRLTELYVQHKGENSIITGVIIGLLLLWCIISMEGVSSFLYFNF